MAADMFIKLGTIKGEAQDGTHKDEIDVLAWSWGSSNSGNAHIGGGAGAGKVNVQDLSFTKYVDKSSSSSILQAVCTGKHVPEVTSWSPSTSPATSRWNTSRSRWSEVLLTSISTGGSGGEDRLTENVTLNFAKFKYRVQGTARHRRRRHRGQVQLRHRRQQEDLG